MNKQTNFFKKIDGFFKKINKAIEKAYEKPKGWTEKEWKEYLMRQEQENFNRLLN